MSSWILRGHLFALRKPVGRFILSHIRLYLHSFGFDIISLAVNIPWAKSTIAPLSLIILSYCAQSSSIGSILSQWAFLLPLFRTSYGRSQIMASTLLSGIFCISTRQSPWISWILSSIILLTLAIFSSVFFQFFPELFCIDESAALPLRAESTVYAVADHEPGHYGVFLGYPVLDRLPCLPGLL